MGQRLAACSPNCLSFPPGHPERDHIFDQVTKVWPWAMIPDLNHKPPVQSTTLPLCPVCWSHAGDPVEDFKALEH